MTNGLLRESASVWISRSEVMGKPEGERPPGGSLRRFTATWSGATVDDESSLCVGLETAEDDEAGLCEVLEAGRGARGRARNTTPYVPSWMWFSRS